MLPAPRCDDCDRIGRPRATQGGRSMTNTTIEPSRRDVLAGAAGVAGAAALGAATFALGHAVAQPAGLPVRRDIATFAADDPQMATFAAAVQEMMDRSARDPNDPKGWLINA